MTYGRAIERPIVVSPKHATVSLASRPLPKGRGDRSARGSIGHGPRCHGATQARTAAGGGGRHGRPSSWSRSSWSCAPADTTSPWSGRRRSPAYNRVLLSSLLAGDAAEGDIALRPAAWYADNGIELLTGTSASSCAPARRSVMLRERCVARLRPAGAGDRLDGRAPADPRPRSAGRRHVPRSRGRGRHAAGAPRRARASSSAAACWASRPLTGSPSAGCRATLLHVMPRLMERQLDARAAALLETAVAAKGIEVVLEAQTAAIEGDGRVERVVLKDGRAYPAELVVMAAGIRPATALAESGGLAIGRGIKVDDAFETSLPGVYAVGECAEHRGACCGLVEPAYEQAKVLARHLAGLPARYEGSLSAASLKVSGVPVFSMGDFEGEGAEAILLEDQDAAAYRKLVIRDGRLAGVRAVRRYRRRALVPRPDPPAVAHRPDPRLACLRQGLRGGRLMSAQDFSEEQRRYLEGFVSGVQARRASQGLKPLGTEGGPARPSQPDPTRSTWRPWPASRRRARSSRPRRRPSATSIPSMPTRASRQESAKGQFPKGLDNFRWRFHGLFYLAPAQNSYMCRLRIANGILSHWQLAGVADLAEALRRRLRARDDARQSANSRHHARGRRAPDRGAGGPRHHHQRDGCRQYPQRHRLAHGRHRPAGAARHPSLRAGLASSHPQRPLALRPAAQVQRRLRWRRRHPRAGGYQRHRLYGRDRRRGRGRGAGRLVPARRRRHHRPPGLRQVRRRLCQARERSGRGRRNRARLHRQWRPHRPQEGAPQVCARRLGSRQVPGRGGREARCNARSSSQRQSLRAQPPAPPGAHRLPCPEADGQGVGRRGAAGRQAHLRADARSRQDRARAGRRRYPPDCLAEPHPLRHRARTIRRWSSSASPRSVSPPRPPACALG